MRVATGTFVVAAILAAGGCTTGARPVEAPAVARTVDIAAPDGVTLKGTLYASASPGPAVLLLHQCDDRRTVWDPLGTRLAAAGVSALAIDYRGYGESGGAPHEKLSNEQLQSIITNTWPGDFDAALAFLSRQTGVDASRIGAAGGSCGVNNVLRLAKRHANVKALALLAGPADREARAVIEAPGAPPVFAGRGRRRSLRRLRPRRSLAVRDLAAIGEPLRAVRRRRPRAVVFKAHPDLADQLAQWFGAVLKDTPAALPTTNGVPLAPAVMQGVKQIDQAWRGGRHARRAGHPLPGRRRPIPPCPKYIVNWLGYEHLGVEGQRRRARHHETERGVLPVFRQRAGQPRRRVSRRRRYRVGPGGRAAHAGTARRRHDGHGRAEGPDPERRRGQDRPPLETLTLLCQERPVMSPAGPTDMLSAAGTFGRPGIVMMSPVLATTNPAPADP
jgi:hypothetical protein